MADEVRCRYDIAKVGTETIAALNAAVSGVIVDSNEFGVFGCSIVSDTTTNPSAAVTRRDVIFGLGPVLNTTQYGVEDAAVNYTLGSIVSSSDADRSTIEIRQTWTIGAGSPTPVIQRVVLNGVRPVDLLIPVPQMVTSRSTDALVVVDTPTVGKVSLYSTTGARAEPTAKLIRNTVAEWTGSVVSTSNADKPGGGGAVLATISYADTAGNPFTEKVTLNGQTPVNLVNVNKYRITSLVCETALGSQSGNQGIITVFSGPNALGGPEAQLAQSYFAYFPPSVDSAYDVFSEFLTHRLASATKSRVVAVPPFPF